MKRVPRRERQERRKMAPFLCKFKERMCKILSVDRSIQSLGKSGVFGAANALGRWFSLKVPDCLARTTQANIWFEYDEYCHSRSRTSGGYSGKKEARRMIEVHDALSRLTKLPTAIVRYGAEPAKYTAEGLLCDDNPALTKSQRIRLCRRVLDVVSSIVPPKGELLVIYVAYARTARSTQHHLDSIHVQNMEQAARLESKLAVRGWKPMRT